MIKTYEGYIFVLCAAVFAAFVTVFGVMIYSIIKLSLRLIKSGVDDERIYNDIVREKNISKAKKMASRVASIAVFVLAITFFVFSILIQANEKSQNFLAIPKVVKSASMSYKNEKNKYLFENNLDNQFDTFDIVFTHKLPDEFELKLYDIVVYEYRGTMVIHRIVGIEEPNEKHPISRKFIFQGDAIQYQDNAAVSYSQMIAIYKGNRIPYVGSFVLFMQSIAGWLCIFLLLFASVATPIIERKLKKEIDKRMTCPDFAFADELKHLNEDEKACKNEITSESKSENENNNEPEEIQIGEN